MQIILFEKATYIIMLKQVIIEKRARFIFALFSSKPLTLALARLCGLFTKIHQKYPRAKLTYIMTAPSSEAMSC